VTALEVGFVAAVRSGALLSGFKILNKAKLDEEQRPNRKCEKVSVDTQCFNLYTNPERATSIPAGEHEGESLIYCECEEDPKSLSGKTKHRVIQGYHQVKDFHSVQVPLDCAPFVTFDTVFDMHKGKA